MSIMLKVTLMPIAMLEVGGTVYLFLRLHIWNISKLSHV
jgi:hypothetical protein